MNSFAEFNRTVDALRQEIADLCVSCGRDAASVEILPVTKTHSAEAVEWVAKAGLTGVGENRVQEAAMKKPAVASPLRWELIGHLQSNKARMAVQLFDRIQSVDSEKLLTVLDRAAADRGKVMPILLQINAGYDPAKFGADLAETPELLETALGMKNLRVDGLMTIAPLSDDPAVAERTFARLRQVRDDLGARFKVGLEVLSMGMSGDYRPAILAGSTQIRIGTRLFGSR